MNIHDTAIALREFGARDFSGGITAEQIEEFVRLLGWEVRPAAEIAIMPRGMEGIEYLPNYDDPLPGAPVAYLRIRGAARVALAVCSSLEPPSVERDFSLEVRNIFTYLSQQRVLPTIVYVLATDGLHWMLYDYRVEVLLLSVASKDLAALAILQRNTLWESEAKLDALPRRSPEETVSVMRGWIERAAPPIMADVAHAAQIIDACTLVQVIVNRHLWAERNNIWLNVLRLSGTAYQVGRLLARMLDSIAVNEGVGLCILPEGTVQGQIAHAGDLLEAIVCQSQSRYTTEVLLEVYAGLARVPAAQSDDLDPDFAMQQLAQYLENASLRQLAEAEIELEATQEVLDAGIIYHTCMHLCEAYLEARQNRGRLPLDRVPTLAERVAAEEDQGEQVDDIPAHVLQHNLRVRTTRNALRAVRMMLSLVVVDAYTANISRYDRFPDIEQAIIVEE